MNKKYLVLNILCILIFQSHAMIPGNNGPSAQIITTHENHPYALTTQDLNEMRLSLLNQVEQSERKAEFLQHVSFLASLLGGTALYGLKRWDDYSDCALTCASLCCFGTALKLNSVGQEEIHEALKLRELSENYLRYVANQTEAPRIQRMALPPYAVNMTTLPPTYENSDPLVAPPSYDEALRIQTPPPAYTE